MKRKVWRIPVIILAVIAFLCVLGIGILCFNGLTISTGRYIESKDGQAIFVQYHSPTVLSNMTGRDMFSHLETGDKILVVHGAVLESYPGQTGARAVLRLKKGTIEDIPKTVIDTLTKLEWLEAE